MLSSFFLTGLINYFLFCRELVRKKAVMVMHHFYRLSPGSVTHLEDDFRRCISDQDPGVMESALILFHDMTVVSSQLNRNVPQSSPFLFHPLSPFLSSILCANIYFHFYLRTSIHLFPFLPPSIPPMFPIGPPTSIQRPGAVLRQHSLPGSGKKTAGRL